MNRLEDRVVPTTVSVETFADAVWGGTNGEVVITRTGSTTASLTVNYSAGGTAVAGTDYTALAGSVTIPAGSSTADVTVVALAGSTDGSDVSVSVASGSGYTPDATPADVAIIDVPDTVTAFGTTATTSVNAPTTVAVLNASSDSMGTALTVTGVTQGADGSVVLNSNGTVTYTPGTGFSGNDSFTYTVEDPYGDQSTGTVSVAVAAPVAASTTTWTAANTAVTVGVLNLGFEVGATLTATGVTQGADGSVVLNGDGTATYTPDSGFTGSDSFTYTVADAQGNTATGTVTVSVGTSVVEALDVAAATAPNTAVTVAVLDSAADLNGDTLTVSGATQGADGSVVVNPDGTVTYTPDAGFSGTDTFTYSVTDNSSGGSPGGLNPTQGGSAVIGTVTVTVGPAAPVALAAAASTTPNTAVTVAVADFASASPGDTLTVSSVTQGADGSVVLNADGTVTYTPNSGFTGQDTFTYTVTDAFGATSTGTVIVSVASPAPVVAAQSTSGWTSAGTAQTFTVLSLATDISGNTLSVSSVTQGADGSVVLNSDGTVSYTPDSGFTGTDSFTYTVTDGLGNSATGTITVTVGPSAPIVAGAAATTATGTAVTVAVLNLASDPNGDALSVSSVTQGADGSVVLNADGTVTYTPNSGFSGTDTFTYTVTDPYGHQTVGTATVTVGTVVPVALSADASTATGTAVNVAVLSFASDPGTLSVSSVTQGADGSVAINANGTVTYTPVSGFTGTDTFTYTVRNAGGQTATATMTVTVGGAAPSAANLLQTENTLATMTSYLSNPDAITNVISALSSAAIAGTNSLLNSITLPSTVSITTGNLATTIINYNGLLANYNKILVLEAKYWNLMLANKQVIDYLNNQILAAQNAQQPNAAL